MLRTAREQIEQLQKYYGDDLDQPVQMVLYDRNEVWISAVDNSSDDELHKKYPTDKDLPKELVLQVLEGLFDSDDIWDTINGSLNWEWEKWHTQKEEEEEAEQDKELWDTEGVSNESV